MQQPVPPVFGNSFVLQRDLDHTGVSGTGTVADGVEFPDGTVAVRWRGEHASTVVWASLVDALHVHGHAGATRVVWATEESNAFHAQRAAEFERRFDDLRDEVQRQQAARERRFGTHDLDICNRDRATAEERVSTAEAERDGAYRERAHLLAWLATHYPAVTTPAPDVDEPGWQLLYLTAPTGQLSWHIAPRDAELLAHVERVEPDDPRAQWDGHTTEEKYERIRQLPARAAASSPDAVRCSCGFDPAAEKNHRPWCRIWPAAQRARCKCAGVGYGGEGDCPVHDAPDRS